MLFHVWNKKNDDIDINFCNKTNYKITKYIKIIKKYRVILIIVAIDYYINSCH